MGVKMEIEICMAWAKTYGCLSTEPYRFWSYSLKHRVENWAGVYIFNGDFLKAMNQLIVLESGLPKSLDDSAPIYLMPKPSMDPFMSRSCGVCQDEVCAMSHKVKIGYRCSFCRTEYGFPVSVEEALNDGDLVLKRSWDIELV
jgi:hypothetical protein